MKNRPGGLDGVVGETVQVDKKWQAAFSVGQDVDENKDDTTMQTHTATSATPQPAKTGSTKTSRGIQPSL